MACVVSYFHLHVHERNELYLPSQAKPVLIYQHRRDGRISWPNTGKICYRLNILTIQQRTRVLESRQSTVLVNWWLSE